jgi:hypothetical protein
MGQEETALFACCLDWGASEAMLQPVDVVNFSTTSKKRNVQMGASISDTASTILLITLLVLGFVATVLWGPSFERLGDDVEAPYIFKLSPSPFCVWPSADHRSMNVGRPPRDNSQLHPFTHWNFYSDNFEPPGQTPSLDDALTHRRIEGPTAHRGSRRQSPNWLFAVQRRVGKPMPAARSPSY